MDLLIKTVVTGLVATAVADAWTLARRSWFGTPLPNYGLVGRWTAHMARGRFRHASIAAAAPVRGESVIGWTIHGLVGIAFAFLLLAVAGGEWFGHPTPLPALLLGLTTVAAPFFVMQPAMGAGVAASRTPRPGASRLHSLVFHGFFGLGLYAGGLVVHTLI
ncbi:MAG TPA: DUF2938 domain-containing protein [Steroidobacteraceae bacterium]|jgi:hypothetical protein|nr:DUF2938 domain-containing protein [Steroidobacteraceae bacterium]